MVTYARLETPGHNRVYYEQSRPMALAELRIAADGAGFACENARVAPIAGVPYFLFDTPAPLSERALRRVCGLSFLYAIYQAEDGGALLRPVARTDAPYADEGIGRILKYTGKTNELFTRMLLHLAVEASDYGDLPPAELWLLDPVMGKGTTLFEGLVRGYNGCGIEVGEQPVREAVQYLKKYLEREKYKHSYKLQRQSGAAGTSGAFRAVRHSFTLAPTKERMKEDSRTLELICANSMYADRLFRKNTFHILAGDLPYGVKHGNVTAENQSAATRNPKQLLETCLPAWHSVLKRGGALALSWNVFVLPRAQVSALLADAGFTVKDGGPWLEFAHRVDQSICRDIIVARKE